MQQSPPTTPIISRELVRFIPFAAQKTFQSAALAAAGQFVAEFDVRTPVTDRNQINTYNPATGLTTGAFPGAANPQIAVGPFLDAAAFSVTTAGTMLVEFAVDLGCLYRTVTSTVVPIGAFANISGLRITGGFVRITYTNTGGVPSLVEFGTYIRST